MNCPICSKNAQMISHATLAPWICSIFGEPRQLSKLFLCVHCDFRFFSLRYSEKQVQILYNAYRGNNYFSIRNRWEPWYQKSENNLYNPDIGIRNIERRRSLMSRELRMANVSRNFRRALDYGGDTGQFFPENVSGERYLVDISGFNDIDSRIRTVRKVTEIPSGSVDLVMACMVLEHVSYFELFCKEVSDVMTSDGLLYVELPLDGFKVHKWHKSEGYRCYLSFLNKIPPLFILMDLISGVVRNYFRMIPVFGVVKQSEHINYFTKQSINSLLNGRFDVRYSSPEYYDERHGKLRIGFQATIASKKTSI
jgi:hypothetical protein